MTVSPQIISSFDPSFHGADLTKTVSRLKESAAHKNLSTIIVTPAFGQIPFKVVMSWLNMQSPPNNQVVRVGAMGMEVGQAYSDCIQNILNTPNLNEFKYVLFLEHDNAPQPDSFVNILKKMEKHKEFAAIGGLYFTKGEGGVAQIWGDPKDPILNYRPQLPDINGGLVECCGTGMGFTIFRLSMFKDPKLRKPWFKTTSSKEEGCQTQDLYFWNDARKHGYRCAIDCSTIIGHYDFAGTFGEPDKMW